MATKRVGIYRNYYGPVPKDSSGDVLSRSQWPKKRTHSWVVRWFGSEGQRYSRSFRTRREAEEHAEHRQSDVREGRTEAPAKMTLEDFGKTYMEIRTDLSERSRQEHARTIDVLKKRLGPARLIGSITPTDARYFISWFRQRKHKDVALSPATVNKVLRECRRIFREAVDCELVRSNPFHGIRQEKVGRIEWHHVTPEEYHRLLATCNSLRWRGMIVLAYCCGMRLGELLNLTWSDIDFEGGSLRVVRKHGETGKTDWTPKDKDTRILPLPRPALSVLTQLQAQADKGQVYVFVNSKGPAVGRALKRQNIWRDFRALRRRADVSPCSMHDLRRSYCTNLSGSVPMHVVQELAGHSDIRTTRQYYVKVRPELVAAASKAVEAIVGSQE